MLLLKYVTCKLYRSKFGHNLIIWRDKIKTIISRIAHNIKCVISPPKKQREKLQLILPNMLSCHVKMNTKYFLRR